MSASLESALVLLARGFSLIPIRPRDKAALIPWAEFQSRRASEAEMQGWKERWPDMGLGIVTGAISGLVVLDVDGEKGHSSIQGLELPPTVTAKTPRGWHYYYRHPGDPVRNAVGLLPGVDVRGDGGYVVCPPSVNADGIPYAWAEGMALWEHPLAEVPGWLLERLRAPKRGNSSAQGDLDPLVGVAEGCRDASAASLMGRLLAKGLSPFEAEELLVAWNFRNRPPMPEGQVRKVARSIAERHTKGHPTAGPIQAFAGPLSALLAQKDQPIDYLAQGLLERGAIGFLAAEPKVGKSILALHAALCLSTGTPVLGCFAVAKRERVLFIEEEDSADLFRRRVHWLCKGHGMEPPEDAYFRIAVRTGFRIDDPRWFEALDKEMEAFKPTIIFVDVLNKVHGAKENEQQGMQPVMEQFEKLRRTHGCGFLILHHFRKAGQDGSTSRGNQQMRGSSVLGGWSECSLYLKPLSGGAIRVEHESKNPTLDPFVFRIQGAKDEAGEAISVQLVHQGDAAVAQETEALNGMLEAVEAAYAEGGEVTCTARMLAKRAKCSPGTARKRLEMLVEAAKVARKGTGTRWGRGVAYIPAEGGQRDQKVVNDHVGLESEKVVNVVTPL